MIHYILCGTEAVRHFQKEEFEELQSLINEGSGCDVEIIAYNPQENNFPLLVQNLSNWLEFCYLTKQDVETMKENLIVDFPTFEHVSEAIFWSTEDFESRAESNFNDLKVENPEEFAEFESWEQLYDKTKFPFELQKMIGAHDCNIGITWETVDAYLGNCEIRKTYPFNEGDDYFTIENGEIVESYWDYVSEEMHDSNPNKKYYRTRDEATAEIIKNQKP